MKTYWSASSDEVSVASGVPQGSVLGPCLFLFYINDITVGLSSTVRLFADDTMLYLTVQNNKDAELLQHDLDMFCQCRRKTLISNRGRWSPLSLFRQVHLGVGKSEYNPPFSGLRAASTWEAVGFCGSHRQTDVLAKLSSWLGG